MKPQTSISLHSPSRSPLFLSSKKKRQNYFRKDPIKANQYTKPCLGQSLQDFWPLWQFWFMNLIGVWMTFCFCLGRRIKPHPSCVPEGKLCQWELGPRIVVWQSFQKALLNYKCILKRKRKFWNLKFKILNRLLTECSFLFSVSRQHINLVLKAILEIIHKGLYITSIDSIFLFLKYNTLIL